MSHIHCIIFDLDGTLVDSLQDITDSVNAVLREAGLPTHSIDAYRQMVGDGLPALVRRAMGVEGDFPAVLAATRERYADHCLDATRLYPGIAELIAAVRARGLTLGVLSNKPHPLTVAVVERSFPPATFASVAGDRPGVPNKPDPSAALEMAAGFGMAPDRCLFVGDTPIDIQTAQSAGMVDVGVAWGFRTIGQLRQAGATFLLEHPMQLLGVLDGLAAQDEKP